MNPATEARWLVDVNALIALMDPNHVHHEDMHHWFARHFKEGWATCAITENGVVRVFSQPAYGSGQRAPADIVERLRILKAEHRRFHTFLSDDISLTDDSLFHCVHLTGAGRVTDAYLLGLAFLHKAKLVSFDRNLPWQAIRGASSSLVERPE